MKLQYSNVAMNNTVKNAKYLQILLVNTSK